MRFCYGWVSGSFRRCLILYIKSSGSESKNEFDLLYSQIFMIAFKVTRITKCYASIFKTFHEILCISTFLFLT